MIHFVLTVLAVLAALWCWGALTRWAWKPDPQLDRVRAPKDLLTCSEADWREFQRRVKWELLVEESGERSNVSQPTYS